MNQKSSRRSFLQTTSGTAAGVATGAVMHTMLRDARAGEANEKVQVALIGSGGMGNADLWYCLTHFPQTECVAVCDVDESHLKSTVANVAKWRPNDPAPKTVKDYKEVLAMKEVDAVFVGTPDHWHAIPMIAAVAAGKDVYCQKPCCHNILEGKAMVEAAAKHKRVVQVGTQQRSGQHFQDVVEYISSGKLGEISMTKTFTYGNETPFKEENMALVLNAEDEDGAPAGVDYDMWLGPAPLRKFNRNRFHNKFRWFFDYAAGMVGDWNVHLQDIVVWAMGNPQPKSVNADGGKLVLTDNRDTPDTMLATYDYEKFVQVYEMRKASGKPWDKGGYGIEFYGTNGKLFVDRSGWEVEPDKGDWKSPRSKGRIKRVRKKSKEKGQLDDQLKPHIGNFLECIKSRGKPIASIEDHFISVTACHLANVSIRVGRKLFWDAANFKCCRDAELKVPDDKATALLGREYRKGYELPQV